MDKHGRARARRIENRLLSCILHSKKLPFDDPGQNKAEGKNQRCPFAVDGAPPEVESKSSINH